MVFVVVNVVGAVKGAARVVDATWRRAMARPSLCGSALAKVREQKAR
jgi:hypothetical protein